MFAPKAPIAAAGFSAKVPPLPDTSWGGLSGAAHPIRTISILLRSELDRGSGQNYEIAYKGSGPEPLKDPARGLSITGETSRLQLQIAPRRCFGRRASRLRATCPSLVLPVSVKKTLLWRTINVESQAFRVPNQGLDCSSAAVLQGKGLRERSVFSQTPVVEKLATARGAGNAATGMANDSPGDGRSLRGECSLFLCWLCAAPALVASSPRSTLPTTQIHRIVIRISPQCHQNFARISNWNALKRGITTTRPSHAETPV